MPDVGILIIGGGIAGCAVAGGLEAGGRGRDVLIIDPDQHAPYDRPPLTKIFLGGDDRLGQRPIWAPLTAGWLSDCVVTVDLDRRTVRTAAGSIISASSLVLTTGGLARTLPGRDARVLTFRTLEDARTLRRLRVTGAHRFLIEGAGPLGLEVASTLATDGADVTVVDPAAAPMERLLGGALADESAAWVRAAGVRLLLDTKVAYATPVGRGSSMDVTRSDGVQETFDCMVTAVGGVPAPVMLVGSSGPVGAAVVDERHRLVDVDRTVFPGVFAAGDVAFHRGSNGQLLRSESWTSARTGGEAVAREILGADPAPEPVPYFWTQQFGRMVQVLGSVPFGSDIRKIAEVPQSGGTLYQALHGGVTVAYIGVDAQRLVASLQIQAGSIEEWVAPEGR